MLRNIALTALAIASPIAFSAAWCQDSAAPSPPATVPVYKVTVVERSLQAVNYQYRSGLPTDIDFRGTVLLPNSKGHATVESKRGRTDIEAKFEKLTPPTPFGRQYLTYVLWAISPDGAPHNLGEIVANGSDNAHVRVTTDLQAFGMIVTAEPYSAVRQPSDVVVLENQVRPDTLGRSEPIQAKAELLSRGQFTYDRQEGLARSAENTPKVSMDEYEQLLEIYQAENALGIARAARADQLASETFNKAQAFYDEAQRLKSSKAGMSQVVQAAREAAETADDARSIAVRRAQDLRVAEVEQKLVQAREETARAQADAARAQADAERTRAEADAVRARAVAEVATPPPPPPPDPAPEAPAPPANPHQAAAPVPASAQTRAALLARLNAVAQTRDTPRGLVITIPDAGFDNTELRSSSAQLVARLAPLVGQPGLHVSVEGYSDSAGSEPVAARRAETVRGALAARGVPNTVFRSFGDESLLTSNATPAGRIENRRVEIVISGNSIGSHALWDHPTTVTLK